MFRFGDGPFLCLNCSAQFQMVIERSQAENERQINYLMDSMDAYVEGFGIPAGRTPRYPSRERKYILSGDFVVNNIDLKNCNVGVLNTGSIKTIDSAVGVLTSNGEDAGASALKLLTEAVGRATDIADETKRQLSELIGALAAEAAAPKPERKAAVMEVILRSISEIVALARSVKPTFDAVRQSLVDLFTGRS